MRTLHRRLLVVAGVVASAAALSAVQNADRQTGLPPARDVVERHVAAMGGATAQRAVRSIHARGRFEITGVGLAGDLSLFAARPNRFVLRMAIPGLGDIEQGFDGKVGWTLNPVAGPEVLTGRELREASDEAWFDRALYEADRVKSITTLERVAFDGRPAYKLRVVLLSGTEAMDYFDVETGHQIGTEAERATPQGVLPTTTIFRAHRQFGPLVQPAVLVQRAIGLEQVLTVTSYEYDNVPDSAFAMPPAIAALIGK